MASTLIRNAAKVANNLTRNRLIHTTVPASSGGHIPPHAMVDPHKGKVVTDEVQWPDRMGLCVGIERWEKLCHLNGIEDPFEMNLRAMGKGTFEEPNRVGSLYNYRKIGCICDEDTMYVKYMNLYKGLPKRCECGYWFRLEDIKPLIFD